MLEIVGRLGVRLGAILLLLTVLARFTDLSAASRIVDGFAMILSAIVVLIGLGCLAVARRTGSIALDGPVAREDAGDPDEQVDRHSPGGFSRRAPGGGLEPGRNPGLRVLLRDGAPPASRRARSDRRARRSPARRPEGSSLRTPPTSSGRGRRDDGVAGSRTGRSAPAERSGRRSAPPGGPAGRTGREDRPGGEEGRFPR
jgi:hypothetical protein